MERVTADELRAVRELWRKLGNTPYMVDRVLQVLTSAADTIDEMDKDIAVFESEDYNRQQD